MTHSKRFPPEASLPPAKTPSRPYHLGILWIGFWALLLLAPDSRAAAAGAQQARVKRTTHRSQLCHGPGASGQIGDYVLENGLIRLVIAEASRASQTGGRGTLVDIGKAPHYIDHFGHLRPRHVTGSRRQLRNDSLRVIKPDKLPPGYAAIEVRGKDRKRRGVSVVTRYELGPTSTSVRIVTTLKNDGATTADAVAPNDQVNWGALAPFVPLYGMIRNGQRTDSQWVSATSREFSVGLVAPKGKLLATHRVGRSERTASAAYRKPTIVPPKQSLTWERRLVVSDGQLSKVSDLSGRLRGGPLATIEGYLTERKTKAPVAGCPVLIKLNPPGEASPLPLTWAVTDERGRYAVRLPLASYVPIPSPIYRPRLAGAFLAINLIEDGQVERRDYTLGQATSLKYKIIDKATSSPCPAKMTFIPIPANRVLDLGPPSGLRARNTIYVASGEGVVNIPPGKYEVTVSRGIEYEVKTIRIDVQIKKPGSLFAVLERVVDTKGYLSVDLGAMTDASYDGLLSPRDRLITAAAEGVELVVTGDEGVATDLSREPIYQTLKPWLNVMVGKRIRLSDQGRPGHFLVFPVDPALDHVALSKKEYAAKDSIELTSLLRQRYPNALIQLNRAIFPKEGLFSTAGYDIQADSKDRALPSSKTVTYDFDLLEVVEGKRVGAWGHSFGLALALANQGKRVTVTGSSNSRASYGEEIGYPRTYVMSSTDDPAKVRPEEIIENLKAGRALISNGPFVTLKVFGKSLGSTVKARQGKCDYEMVVQAPQWVRIATIETMKNGLMANKTFITRPIEGPTVFPNRSEDESPFRRLPTKRDAILNIAAIGKGYMAPVLAPLPFGGAAQPFCLINPIYIDADGDGKCTPPQAP